MILSAPAQDAIRIRKYPNRRLYDTSRSTHLTHDEVLAIVRRGQRVQISDSRTETDITNEVLLQILIAREPAIVAALPTNTLLAIARSTPESTAAAAASLGEGSTGNSMLTARAR
jgi:polyhydroxyalkanoate synthesis repressor PhaR